MMGLLAVGGVAVQIYLTEIFGKDDDQGTSPDQKTLCSTVITAVRTLKDLDVDYSQMPFTAEDLNTVVEDFADCKPSGDLEKAGEVVGAALFFSAHCEMLKVFAGQPREAALAEIFKHTLPLVGYWGKAAKGTAAAFWELNERYKPLPCETTPGEGSPSFTQRIALDFVCSKVDEISSEALFPAVIVFDLDDTLFSTDQRLREILREFALSDQCQPACSEFADILTTLPTWGINFGFLAEIRGLLLEAHKEKRGADLDEDLKGKLEAVSRFEKFWAARFFSNEYYQYDTPWPGAVEYVNALYGVGAEIFYVSGRSVEVASATLLSLAKYGFPLPHQSDRVHLMLKPDSSYRDGQFKAAAMAGIFAGGDRLGAALFENNLTHILAMLPYLPPEMKVVMVGTMHRSIERGAKIPEGIMLIKDFRE